MLANTSWRALWPRSSENAHQKLSCSKDNDAICIGQLDIKGQHIVLALLEGQAAELLLNGLLALSLCPFKSQQRVLRIEATKNGAVGIKSVVVVIYKSLQREDRPQDLLQALRYMPNGSSSSPVTIEPSAADLANILWIGH